MDHRRVAPGLMPDGLWVRMVTSDGTVLAEHPLRSERDSQTVGQADVDQADAWLREHPRGHVWTYVYDGDSGDCMVSIQSLGLEA